MAGFDLRSVAVCLVPLMAALLAACGGPDESSDPDSSVGGAGAGAASIGGAAGSGGTASSGGVSTGGDAVTTGGTDVGGNAPTGGTTETGGVAGMGGGGVTGGVAATGGLATGGLAGTGGALGSGGSEEPAPWSEEPEMAAAIASQDAACTAVCELDVTCPGTFGDVEECRSYFWCFDKALSVNTRQRLEYNTMEELLQCLSDATTHMNCVAALDCAGYLAWWDEEPTPFPCSAEQTAEEEACAGTALFGY